MISPPELAAALRDIQRANPANEAEVETKILLHIFRLLGYSDLDRADKPTVAMHFGRERKNKTPDFLLYDGIDRTLGNALVAVEAKDTRVGLDDATSQAKSYATWAGTPFYVVCNGLSLRAVQFIPAAEAHRSVECEIADLEASWPRIAAFLSKPQTVLAKERLGYASLYLPELERLPAGEFFQEYLTRLAQRFAGDPNAANIALTPPTAAQTIIPRIPVTVRLSREGAADLGPTQLLGLLDAPNARVLVTAAPGSGKSTLCRRLVRTSAEEALAGTRNALPIYVRLATSVPQTAAAAFTIACGELGIRVFRNLFAMALAHARLIIVLDGLDEVEPSDVTRAKLTELIRDCGRHGVLMTTRPVGLLEFEASLPLQDFRTGEIRPLSDIELRRVFGDYLGDSSKAVSVFESVPNDLRESLRTPLFALMAIRVAQTLPTWTRLNRFGLFTAYVDVMDRFFSASTVRPRASSAHADAATVLGMAAAYLSTQTDPAAWSLQTLSAAMTAQGFPDVTDRLLNTGLLTVGGGALRFSHNSFFDFGLAHFGLTAIGAQAADVFASARYTPAAYELIHSQLTATDQSTLERWFDGTGALARGILNIWRFGCSRQAIDLIHSGLRHQTSHRVWALGMRALAAQAPGDFVNSYESVISGHRHSRKARLLGTALVASRRHEYFPVLVRMAKEKANSAYAGLVTQFVLQLSYRDGLDTVTSLYTAKTSKGRLEIVRVIDRYRESGITARLISLLLQVELDPSVALMLLYAGRDALVEIEPASVARAVTVCRNIEHSGRSSARLIRRIRRAMDSVPNAVARLPDLAIMVRSHRRSEDGP